MAFHMVPVAAASNVSRRYGETTAVDRVSLRLEAGEVLALIGPNGAGKTTLVRLLTGTTSPTDGTVSLFGADPARMDRSRIGVLPQAFDPPTRLSGRELLRYYAGLYDEPMAVDAALETVGMADSAGVRYDRLSGGQKRRICVAITLLNDPDLLVLDEPTTGIDPAGRRALWGVIERRAAEGRTVLLTTHDMGEAEAVADRVALIDGGTILETGEPTALIDRHGGENTLIVEGCSTAGPLRAREYSVRQTDRSLVVRGIEPVDIAAVVDALDAAGVGYTGVRWSPPTLEDVYFALTGDRYDPGEVGSR